MVICSLNILIICHVKTNYLFISNTLHYLEFIKNEEDIHSNLRYIFINLFSFRLYNFISFFQIFIYME